MVLRRCLSDVSGIIHIQDMEVLFIYDLVTLV